MTTIPGVDETRLIGVDWGTPSLRAYRMDESGEHLEERASKDGIMAVKDGAFEETLSDIVGDWLGAVSCPIILSGMITSRQGWVELPYVSCPAGKHELSAAIHHRRLSGGREIHFVTGVTTGGPDRVPDVMRGEETQIIGALGIDRKPGLFVLPGTHSKWARTNNEKIVDFATFMTGEVFSVLSRHSILGRMMEGDDHDQAAFVQGVAYGRQADKSAGGLLKRLFGSRALGLFGTITGAGAASHLAGLLIGTEIREALDCLGDNAEPNVVTVLGEPDLVDLYVSALGQFGVEAMTGRSATAARGQFAIAEAAGLLREQP
jgi:2-dehydro-3-deoxygalactonokinase